MSKWRELKYYAHGTPTKTTIRLRRRHLFSLYRSGGEYRSPCGLYVISKQFSEGPTDAQKCGHCVKAMVKKGRGK